MEIVKGYPDGIFCWVDLATSDVDGAKAFYGGLFGWDADDVLTDMGPVYTMFNIEGNNVAGLGPLSPDMQAQGIPSHWNSYIKDDNVDALAERITAAGGTVMFPPMDVMQQGRMTFAHDPTGAAFGIWQPINHTGAQLVNAPNTLVWNELQTRDGAGALAFYTEVMGWGQATDPTGYTTFTQNDRIHAGLIPMDESWPAEVPPNWTVYFMVEDVEAAAARVQELGGNVLMPPTPAGELGKFSIVQDPQGAVFNVIQFSGPVDEPPQI